MTVGVKLGEGKARSQPDLLGSPGLVKKISVLYFCFYTLTHCKALSFAP